MRFLESFGYRCFRSAGSHGEFDVIGIGSHSIVLVQVKKDCWPSPAEREQLALFPVPPNTIKMVHRWDTGARVPRVEEVR